MTKPGFQMPSYVWLKNGPSKMWLIRTTNLGTMECRTYQNKEGEVTVITDGRLSEIYKPEREIFRR